MFTRNESNSVQEIKPFQKQIKIPDDGQLSKKGTIIKTTRAVEEVDYSIADIVEDINNAGFISQFSCSGLKKDHPYREVKQDGAYISFMIHDNNFEALNFIQKTARSLNLTVEQCMINHKPALVVRIDKDRAGNSLLDRIKIANELVNKSYSYNTNQKFGAFTKDLDAIIKKCGGLIYDTDEKIEMAWKKFGAGLLGFSCQNAS